MRSRLDAINWNFPSSGSATSSIHHSNRFPGNFIPQIPSYLIQILSDVGDIVLDPFCGTGTTGIEALRLGRSSWCCDALAAPIAIARGKLAQLRHPLNIGAKQAVIAELAWKHLCETTQVGALGEGADQELEKWYSKRTLAQLRFLWKLIERFAGDARFALELIFAETLVASASTAGSLTRTGKVRKHHWGWIADNVVPKQLENRDAIGSFEHLLLRLPEEHLALVTGVTPSVALVQADARSLPFRAASVDLIVTSPPYAGVIDYTHANRLLYLWKGWSIRAERTREIGARYRRGRTHFVDEYVLEMRRCWAEFGRVLKPGAHCAIVLGHSRAFPGTSDLVLNELAKALTPVWGPTYRTVSRRRLSTRDSTEFSEQIRIFRKS